MQKQAIWTLFVLFSTDSSYAAQVGLKLANPLLQLLKG